MMNSIKTLTVFGCVLFLFKTSVLTSTVNSGADISNTPDIHGLQNLSKSIIEGGGSLDSSTLQNEEHYLNQSTISEKVTKINVNEDIPQKGNAKLQPKIVPRKGADQMIHYGTEEAVTPGNRISSFEITPELKLSTTMEPVKTVHFNESKENLTAIGMQLGLSNITDKTHKPVASDKKMFTNKTVIPNHIKSKPTIVEGDAIQVLPTRSSSFGISIVITIVAIPLLVAAAFIMYKQGRDCWDKRHYRRMDFLIDGMYND